MHQPRREHTFDMTDIQESDELYALRSPLSPGDAAERLRALGSIAPRDTTHRTIVALDVFASDDPFSAPIGVEIERRPLGSYVTARVGENEFVRDFARVVRCVLTLYALVAAGYLAFHLPTPTLVRALLGIIAGWMSLLGAVALGVSVATRESVREIKPLRIRHQLARILCRK